MKPGEIKRLYFIVRVFLDYGLDELLLKTKFSFLLKLRRYILFWLVNKYPNKSFGERLRLALQTLGPVWIKFGQMLSTRPDLFSSCIYQQLSLLQNNVISFDGNLARCYIEKSLGGSIETWFNNFNEIPLASASIAQVHSAILKQNNKQIVIKVIRPDILPIIKVDINLMYRLAYWISRIFRLYRLRLYEIVQEYEKVLINELNLLYEASNTIQLRRNFKNSSMLYIPKIYIDYCHKNIMVMERISGIPVSNVEELKKQGINIKLLAERGVEIFFIQVFRDSFFHADMHPGNIFISKEHKRKPKYIGIDCAIIGSLNKQDKRYLAENFIAFFNRDYRKIAELHINSHWVSINTNIVDFEFAIRKLCEPMFRKPLSDISFGTIFLNLFSTAKSFNIKIQPQLLLFQKTLLYIEGLGKQLYPDLDLWKTAKPFLEDWINEQISFTKIMYTLKHTTPYLLEQIPEIPNFICKILQQYQNLENDIYHPSIYLQQRKYKQKKRKKIIKIGIILLLFLIVFKIFNVELNIIIYLFLVMLLTIINL